MLYSSRRARQRARRRAVLPDPTGLGMSDCLGGRRYIALDQALD